MGDGVGRRFPAGSEREKQRDRKIFQPFFIFFCINGLANTPELNCTDGTDNAGQSHAASVARKVGGIG